VGVRLRLFPNEDVSILTVKENAIIENGIQKANEVRVNEKVDSDGYFFKNMLVK
jgi:hypothetical protein